MKTNHSQSKIGDAILVFSLLFGIGFALSATGQAQHSDDRHLKTVIATTKIAVNVV